LNIEDIMSKCVQTVHAQDDADDAYHRMRGSRINHLVVLKNDHVIGVLSSTDLGGRCGADIRRGKFVTEFMSWSVNRAESNTTVSEAAILMRGNSVGYLLVFEDNKLVGIVTVSDLLDLISRAAALPWDDFLPRHVGNPC
jgi:CBS domain-containing protein